MMSKESEFWVSNISGMLGSLYVSKSSRKIGIDFSFLICWIILSIATATFIGSTFEVSKLTYLDNMSGTEKYWVGFKWSIYVMLIIYYVIMLFRWCMKYTNTYSFNKININMVNVPWVSYSLFNEFWNSYHKEEMKKKKEETSKSEVELQEDINNLINKLNK